MRVFQIHFNYGPSADDQLYYSGSDYPKLFTCKEYAEKVAMEQMEEYPQYEWGDWPISYNINEIEVDTTTL